MSFKDVVIDLSYETLKDDPVNDFYVPVLAEAVSYDRIAGFFSSASLAVAARGIAGLISNRGTMRVIASPRLNEEDISVIRQAVSWPEQFIEKRLIECISTIEEEFQRNHLQALGWMLANRFLEMRLAVVVDEETGNVDTASLFHQKVGILRDSGGDQVSFSGSINETAAGWLANVEEFKVFKSWEPGQASYLQKDVKRFEELWSGRRRRVRIYPLPQAVAAKLVEIGSDFSQERLAAEKYISSQRRRSIHDALSLFPFQKNAVQKWIASNHRLLFEMATGTGKTRTAIACIYEMMRLEQRTLTVVACPQNTLSRQWKTEVESIGLEFDASPIVDGSNPGWRKELEQELKSLAAGFHRHAIVYTTHATASSDDFIAGMKKYVEATAVCLVGDEVHGLGAFKTKRALLDEYQYRIGLSATPARWFDDYGTAVLQSYFGDASFQFTIADALRTINPLTKKPFLVEYEYYPVFVKLNDDEFEDYVQLTSRIRKMAAYSRDSDEYQARLDRLLFARANIQKRADGKYAALIEVLKKMGSVDSTLIFTADAQIDRVMQILRDLNIIAHRFTQSQETRAEAQYGGLSERQDLIRKFKENAYQALVAIKCLDEGIDIPYASTAIIMSSSTNPREYVQRIGRVIRQADRKGRARVFDLVVEPDLQRIEEPNLAEFERTMFAKEMTRMRDMSANSINNADVLFALNARMGRLADGA